LVEVDRLTDRTTRVQQLRTMLAGAGSLVPGTLPPSNMFSHMATPLNGMPSDVTLNSAMSTIIPPNLPTLPVIAQLSPPLDQTPMTFDETPIPSFDMFFNLDDDMDGEHDGDFLPTSSPKHDSSGESDFENETPSTSHKRKQKGKRKVQIQQDEDDEDDDFVDPEVEDEDLFLPIEDVPIPEDLKQDAMRSLGVDNQAQLVNLINKMVNAGQERMTSETVEKLKVLLTLVGPRGGWSG
jgi:hypothetical protein